MSKKALLVSAPLGLGALVVLWAAVSVRGATESATPAPKKKPALKAALLEPVAEAGVATPSAASTSTTPATGADALILDRIRRMEERLQTLETRKQTLARSNEEMERKVAEKLVDTSARMMAEWRVRAWEQQLRLSETQKQALMEIVTRWQREDAGKPAGRETWLGRESELRSRLSVEQASALQESAIAACRQQWAFLGQTIGGMVGASTEDQARFKQSLGDYIAPNAMLLPEAHGWDWPGMLREGAGRLRPGLTSDQLTRLDRFVPN